ncbi:hypothetical protein [Legionella longbeachae]|uniref:hypothetical protein n=1 Tax=Legionella longbeachae TaxID=450 RepID=UPI0001BEB8BB|nr:hypothetical protein [Legionella longbeachae]EEZ94543.1 hypothetical protein LLB_3454 [Legionella longbeachae D-4968]ARB90889.1 hypothetical protein A6J40_01175 [Legionella longbeachae]QIN32610.1 hypothetical protein GCB94_10895 [Legionella longbeachae]QIN35963.1 hypothetical protein GCS73_10155 [Legionella longbeachae]RZV22154.1 hypothetical protein EKG34_15450 [Legionella longbeachae]
MVARAPTSKLITELGITLSPDENETWKLSSSLILSFVMKGLLNELAEQLDQESEKIRSTRQSFKEENFFFTMQPSEQQKKKLMPLIRNKMICIRRENNLEPTQSMGFSLARIQLKEELNLMNCLKTSRKRKKALYRLRTARNHTPDTI